MSTLASPAMAASRPRLASQSQSRPVAHPQPLRLTARGRRVVALLVAMPIAALLALGTAHRAAAADQQQMSTVVVQPGQSLWQIAATIDPEADPRAVIEIIERINGLSSASVAAGQQLVIPAAS